MTLFGAEWYHKAGAAAYIEWGLAHNITMILLSVPSWQGNLTTMYLTTYSGPVGVKYAADYEAMRGKWPAYSGKVASLLGFDLGWIGAWSIAVGLYFL